MKEYLNLPAELNGKVWVYQATGPWSARRSMHRHDELEVNLVLAGSAKYFVGEQSFELKRNTQIWFFAEHEHVLLGQSPNFAMWIGVFRPRMIREICQHPAARELRRRNPKGSFCRTIPADAADRLDSLFSELMRASDDMDRYNAGLGYLLLTAWHEHLETEKPTVSRNVHPAVERAARLLRDETEPLSLADLAELCQLSPSRLSRLFKSQAGLSLGTYRNRQRVDRFIRFYGSGRSMTVTDAALAAGFGSYPQFHRVFQQIMGYNPAEHRHHVLKAKP